jgi:SAM-dependent methyltransferase
MERGGVTMSMSSTCSDAMVEADGYNQWVVDQFSPWFGDRVVEIGLGHGGFFKHLPQGIRYWGVDIDSEVISHCQMLYPNNKYQIFDITSKQFSEFCRESDFDTILCFNVIEHIENDHLAIRQMLEGLKVGGVLHLFVPAHKLLYNDMDRLAGHYRRYDRQRLASVLPREGVDLIKMEYFNPVGGLGWLLNRLVKHDSLNSDQVNTQIRIYEKYLLPISKVLNPISRIYFGQSLLAILRKTR